MLGNRYHIVTALDGQDALDKLRWLYSSQEDPDAIGLPNVIVSDVMMPKVDGFELIKLLRANKRFRSIPVVILSARAGEEARVEGLRLGADDYLCKPFSSKVLFLFYFYLFILLINMYSSVWNRNLSHGSTFRLRSDCLGKTSSAWSRSEPRRWSRASSSTAC